MHHQHNRERPCAFRQPQIGDIGRASPPGDRVRRCKLGAREEIIPRHQACHGGAGLLRSGRDRSVGLGAGAEGGEAHEGERVTHDPSFGVETQALQEQV